MAIVAFLTGTTGPSCRTGWVGISWSSARFGSPNVTTVKLVPPWCLEIDPVADQVRACAVPTFQYSPQTSCYPILRPTAGLRAQRPAWGVTLFSLRPLC